MTPNKANIDLVFRSLSAEFNNAYSKAATTWMAVAMLVNSTTKSEEYPWLEAFPQMRKWVGERVIKQLAAHAYRLENEDWEATIEIDKNDFSDDRLQMYSAQARTAAEAAAVWADEMVMAAINNSFARTCHDGQNFFDTDHPLAGAADFSNKLTAQLKADTQANAAASFGAAEIALMEMADPEGRPMGLMPKTLLVPPALKATANTLMTADRLDDKPNPYKGAAEVECNARLTSRTAWFLLAEGAGGLKPFLWQLRQQPQIDSVMDPTNPHVFMTRNYLFGIHGRGVAGYTLPQLAVGSDGSA